MRKFLTGVAMAALLAGAASADPGGNKGGGEGKGKGGGQAAASHADHGKGGGKGNAGNGGGKVKFASNDKGQGNGANAKGNDDRGNAGKGNAGRQDAVVKVKDRGNDAKRADFRNNDDRNDRVYVDRDRDDDRWDGDRWDDRDRWTGEQRFGLVDGCPPGLAKKNNGCMPPGLAKQRTAFSDPSWWGLRNLSDGRYTYYDGNLVRFGEDGRILSYLPLLAGALAPGSMWPSSFGTVALPPYYQDFYGLGSSNGYRYYDNTIYRVDPETMAINSIAALLTGDQITVGQPMPTGYSVYNVPYAYRDRYVDGPDAMYRYSDGYVYQVDPKTRLVAAAIELLT